MEARQTLRGTGVPKVLVIVLAACMAIALAIGASVLAKDFTSSSSAVTSTVHPAAGTVLRQDNPANSAAPWRVIEQAPYSSPVASPAQQPTRDPKGFAVPI